MSACAKGLLAPQKKTRRVANSVSVVFSQDKRNEASKSTFSWLAAFAHLRDSEVGVVIFEYLPLVELRNAAFTSKAFHAIIKNDASLSWRFHLSAAPKFVELLNLEDGTPHAQRLTTSMLHVRRDLFVKFRKILFDWLVDVQGEYQLSTETLHLAFNLIDRCFERTVDIPTEQIQLLGATCLFIASKMNETTHPSTTEMAWVCDNAFSKEQFRSMEMQVLFGQQFKVRSVTPCEFVGSLCFLLDLPPAIEPTASYLIDLFMLEAESIGVASSAIAGASIILAIYYHEITSKIAFKDVAYVTRTPVPEIRALICRIQRFHMIDYFSNGNGKTDATVKRPLCDWKGPAMQAVNRRHASAARAAPLKIRLLQDGSCCSYCPWCRKSACAEDYLRTFPCHHTFVQPAMSPCCSFESRA